MLRTPALRRPQHLMRSLLLILPAMSGCAADAGGARSVRSTVAALETSPRLGAGDQLRIVVYGEDRISGPVMVGQDGVIALPLAGQIRVVDLTPAEAEKAIAARLKGPLVSPRVTVTVTAWRPIYVTGEVERAGEYPWRPGLNLMSAVAMAGGATRRASTREILVQRQGKGPLVPHSFSPETHVSPGDLLKMPERLF